MLYNVELDDNELERILVESAMACILSTIPGIIFGGMRKITNNPSERPIGERDSNPGPP
jgi:muramoyltetrapeptide carboxypeptidase LdcA involved in peptidoglycan recycling